MDYQKGSVSKNNKPNTNKLQTSTPGCHHHHHNTKIYTLNRRQYSYPSLTTLSTTTLHFNETKKKTKAARVSPM